MSAFENKLVAVMNEKLEAGVVMNALAHMSIGFGASLGEPALRLTNYEDADGAAHSYISEMPFMILKANSNKIRGLRASAKEKGIRFVDFVHTMTEGTYLEQLDKTKHTKDEALIYYGIILFGPWDIVTE